MVPPRGPVPLGGTTPPNRRGRPARLPPVPGADADRRRDHRSRRDHPDPRPSGPRPGPRPAVAEPPAAPPTVTPPDRGRSPPPVVPDPWARGPVACPGVPEAAALRPPTAGSAAARTPTAPSDADIAPAGPARGPPWAPPPPPRSVGGGKEMPSMGQDVNTHAELTLAALSVAASVRDYPARGSACREWCRVRNRRSHRETPEDFTADSFSAWEREPSFYQGLSGPLLRSALPGGIAYSWGLRPEGRDQNFRGCSPL